MNKLLAADIKLAPNGGFKGFGKLGLEDGASSNADLVFTQFLSSAIGVMTIIAFIWFIFVFFMGAIGIISSGGDKQALETARKKITSGIIGIVVVIAAIFIIKLIGYLIGIPDILNFASLFGQTSNNIVR